MNKKNLLVIVLFIILVISSIGLPIIVQNFQSDQSLENANSASLSQRFLSNDSLTINYNSDNGIFIPQGLGFINTLAPNTSNENYNKYLANLNPLFIREEWNMNDYNRLSPKGTKFYKVINSPSQLIGPNVNWQSWTNWVIQKVTPLKGKNIHWEIFNEPDNELISKIGVDNFYKAWEMAYKQIRQIDPGSYIVGPSFNLDTKRIGYWDGIKNFLTYAKNNNVLPDVLSYHEGNPDKLVEHYNNIKSWMINSNINIKRISISEYLNNYNDPKFGDNQNYKSYQKPGIIIHNLVEIAKTDVESAGKTCWWQDINSYINNECSNNTISGLLSEKTKEPRNKWFLYNYYSQMQGNKLIVTEKGSSQIKALATKKDNQMEVLIGRASDSSNSFELNINLNNSLSLKPIVTDARLIQFHCNVKEIDCNTAEVQNTVNNPIQLSGLKFQYINGRYTAVINNLGPWDSMYIKIEMQEKIDDEPNIIVPKPDTVAVIRVFENKFDLLMKSANDTGIYADREFSFTKSLNSNDVVISGDWNNNGRDSLGIFNKENKVFSYYDDNNEFVTSVKFPNDISVGYTVIKGNWYGRNIKGNWDGKTGDSIGFYDNKTGTFLLYNLDATLYTKLIFGGVSEKYLPIVGDWDGDGIDTVGIYSRDGNVYLRNSNTTGNADIQFLFGPVNSNFKVFSGDWNNDGKDSILLFNPQNVRYYFKFHNNTGFADLVLHYGLPTDIPIVGKWNI